MVYFVAFVSLVGELVYSMACSSVEAKDVALDPQWVVELVFRRVFQSKFASPIEHNLSSMSSDGRSTPVLQEVTE